MCWVKRGFCSSEGINSCWLDWLDESALLAVAAVRSKRWNQPSAPTATTKFCRTNTRRVGITPKYSWLPTVEQRSLKKNYLSFVADVSDCNTSQLEKQNRLDEQQRNRFIVEYCAFWFVYWPSPHSFLWSRVWTHHSCTQAAFHWCLPQPARSTTTYDIEELFKADILYQIYSACD